MRKLAIIIGLSLTLSLARGESDLLLSKEKPKGAEANTKGPSKDIPQDKTIWSIFGTAIQLGQDPQT